MNLASKVENNQGDKKETINKLVGTAWSFEVADGFTDYIQFHKKDSIISYSCEVGVKVFGVYKLKHDTIFIQTIRGQYDHEFPEGSRHRHKRIKYQLLYKVDSIISPLNKEIKYFKSAKCRK